MLAENVDCHLFITAAVKHITGSISRSASRRYLIHSEGDFEVFRGRHVVPEEGSVPNFTPTGATTRV